MTDQNFISTAAAPTSPGRRNFTGRSRSKDWRANFIRAEKLFAAPETFEAEEKDFAAALQEGRIRPADPAAATLQQKLARAAVERADPKTAEPLPAEFASEFADYHRGAFAYNRGPEHFAEAQEAWEALLRRPEAERHYRSTWAAFMLGKLALKENDPAAVGWFERTRELARAGFGDSLGLAADSYGWQARSEWKQDRPEKAAALYLTQLALGDESAIVSLKALVPDRETEERMLFYNPRPQSEVVADLERAARDPLLRRLVTVHILAVGSMPEAFCYGQGDNTSQRFDRWLELLRREKLTEIEDAEYIGWAAYNNGDYAAAARWLEMAQKADSPASLWLRAKLQRRAGKLSEAAKNMALAWETLRASPIYGVSSDDDVDPYFNPHWSLTESATGDLGALRLERSDYLLAFETLFNGDLWSDAAFVAERVLTTKELKSFVDDHGGAANESHGERWKQLRYLLGRRLVREERYPEAQAYLAPPFDQVLAKYVAALRDGRDQSRPRTERARALFTAAWLARYDGMELMGTEGAPDNFLEGGNFEGSELARAT